ncbi:TerC family protein [Enterobacter quasiroggenkampii]|uniref:TerC family protein n=1 Tax=Enterobacter quasiroggenkampii TaxID=2497436 RepID=A0ABY8DWB3_9ENTR|nr:MULTISPECIES: TerC family protein [Enterobacter]EGS2005617.1 TerC family protein [Enterobacter cloacae]MBG0621295.1 TerC family protein [Enterobacter roggenkampii]MCM7166006.1 TerC family protein [Enterobacter quasiroggenkampii]MCU6358329.1 TerC family protein [Enterobacter quasiroggenkampii]MEB7931166.1 TerC family protein [Enterobacter quasiroggenkampii]
MEWIADPSIWAGLVTLVVIELVLGIDNLVFIAILAEKLPPSQRDRARVTGLLLAMVMRLLLLASISWLVTLTQPLFSIHGLSFSARDLIMLFGGLFLLFKATVELNERLEGKDSENPTQRRGAKFWPVVAQIVVLDAVFSLDSVITAVGMVDHLAVMMAAVIIAITLMVMASKALTRFVNSHPTIVILCLSFLLMIGFSLVADGFGFHIPKGYLYAAIGFSVMIEALNQLAIFNRRRFLSANQTLRQRTADTVMRLLSGKKEDAELDAESSAMLADHSDGQIFDPQERRMIERVLNLNQRTVSSIMTSRHDIEHIDLTAPEAHIRALLDKNQHTRVVVTGGEAEEELLGVVHVIDLLQQQLHGEPLNLRVLVRQPLVFPEGLPLLSALEQFRNARTHFAFVVDEFGSVEGLVTLSDVMETIAGNLPNEVDEIDARHDIQKNADGSWTANGHMPLEDLVQYVPLPLDEKREYHTIAGLLMEYLQRIPQPGEEVQVGDYRLKTLQIENHRVQKVQLIPLRDEEELDFEV